MPKLLVPLFSLVIIAGLVGCGGGDKPSPTPTPTQAPSPSPTPTETAASLELTGQEAIDLVLDHLDTLASSTHGREVWSHLAAVPHDVYEIWDSCWVIFAIWNRADIAYDPLVSGIFDDCRPGGTPITVEEQTCETVWKVRPDLGVGALGSNARRLEQELSAYEPVFPSKPVLHPDVSESQLESGTWDKSGYVGEYLFDLAKSACPEAEQYMMEVYSCDTKPYSNTYWWGSRGEHGGWRVVMYYPDSGSYDCDERYPEWDGAEWWVDRGDGSVEAFNALAGWIEAEFRRLCQ